MFAKEIDSFKTGGVSSKAFLAAERCTETLHLLEQPTNAWPILCETAQGCFHPASAPGIQRIPDLV